MDDDDFSLFRASDQVDSDEDQQDHTWSQTGGSTYMQKSSSSITNGIDIDPVTAFNVPELWMMETQVEVSSTFS